VVRPTEPTVGAGRVGKAVVGFARRVGMLRHNLQEGAFFPKNTPSKRERPARPLLMLCLSCF
jgi:hypothetical protein